METEEEAIVWRVASKRTGAGQGRLLVVQSREQRDELVDKEKENGRHKKYHNDMDEVGKSFTALESRSGKKKQINHELKEWKGNLMLVLSVGFARRGSCCSSLSPFPVPPLLGPAEFGDLDPASSGMVHDDPGSPGRPTTALPIAALVSQEYSPWAFPFPV